MPAKRYKAPQKKKLNIGKIIMFILLLSVFLYSTITLILWYFNNKKTDQLTQNIIADAVSFTTNEQKEESYQINFEKLKQINSDTVAWIKIDQTSINYPVVQGNDNEYYLKKDINRKNNQCGWIYMDYRNNPQLTDQNTFLFGHNIKAGIMFADLQKIYQGKLGNQVIITMYLPNKQQNYQVFSVYMEEPKDESIQTDVTDPNFAYQMQQKSKIKFEVSVNSNDKILTLSTCDNSGKKRILVHAKQQ